MWEKILCNSYRDFIKIINIKLLGLKHFFCTVQNYSKQVLYQKYLVLKACPCKCIKFYIRYFYTNIN